ncbi:glycoside hydrolase family 76 protein, partial [Lepidopterella palustris CBS 459.81]
GIAWGALVDYWFLTGNDKWSGLVSQGMLAQVRPNYDYSPPGIGGTEVRLAAMSATELTFINHPSYLPQWIDLAHNVFSYQTWRWDDQSRGGGLHQQLDPSAQGYSYKSTTAAANFFLLSSRLAQYMKNGTYQTWAVKQYQWMNAIRLTDFNHHIFDGPDSAASCSQIINLA